MSQNPAPAVTKSTLGSRSTANPRRTTLASVEDFSQLPGIRADRQSLEYGTDLPQQTANPRRTILMKLPEQQRV